jgi:hypothetical protein
MVYKKHKGGNGMAEHLMETTWRTALWRQLGAAIDMLENALLACPAPLWKERVFREHPDHSLPAGFDQFWSITYHVLFGLDWYLTGSPEGFAPPAPFTWNVLDPASVFPEQPYTKEELHSYLVQVRVARARQRWLSSQTSKRTARSRSPVVREDIP